MTRSEPRKFLFETSFSKNDMAYQKTFVSPEEVSLAKKLSFEEGYQVSQKSLEALNKEQLGAIAKEIERLFDEARQRECRLHHVVAKLAQSALEAAFPYYAKKASFDEISSTIEACLAKEMSSSVIKIYVNSQSCESIQEKVNSYPFEGGLLHVMSDDSLGASECRLEWQDSGYERLEGMIKRDLVHLLQRLDAQEEAILSFDTPQEEPITQGEHHE